MTNNIFISYDLHLKKDYPKIIDAIKELSPHWAKVHLSLWWISTPLNATEVRDKLAGSIDPDDSLFVINASGNHAAWSGKISDEVARYLRENWSK